MDEPEELDAMPPVDFDNMSLDEVLDAVRETLLAREQDVLV